MLRSQGDGVYRPIHSKKHFVFFVSLYRYPKRVWRGTVHILNVKLSHDPPCAVCSTFADTYRLRMQLLALMAGRGTTEDRLDLLSQNRLLNYAPLKRLELAQDQSIIYGPTRN